MGDTVGADADKQCYYYVYFGDSADFDTRTRNPAQLCLGGGSDAEGDGSNAACGYCSLF